MEIIKEIQDNDQEITFIIYRICRICFNDMNSSGEFLYVLPDTLSDIVGDSHYLYVIKGEDEPCDAVAVTDPVHAIDGKCQE